MNSFDKRVIQIDKDLLEIKNNMRKISKNNHKTINNIADNINSLSIKNYKNNNNLNFIYNKKIFILLQQRIKIVLKKKKIFQSIINIKM